MDEERGFFGKMWDHLKERMSAIPGEVGDMAMQKTAQGAAELSQALNSQSNAYVPYGYAQQPLEIEGPQQSYADMLREASQRAVPEQGQEMER